MFGAARRYVAETAAPYRVLASRVFGGGATAKAAREDVAAMLHDGGMMAFHALDRGCAGACELGDRSGCDRLGIRCQQARSIGIVVQLDGDVMLSLPSDFSASPAELAAAAAVKAETRIRLRRIADHGPLAVAIAATQITGDLATFGVSGWGFYEGMDTVIASLTPGAIVPAAGALALVAVPVIGKAYVRPALGWIVRRLARLAR